ncbi:MAG: 16S rRNA (adenine(1518)-N(6)/adenine(1519)-N(6))-dimethyltransferase RsmA [Chitinophagaceae bacterium]|jgi:16S rRNA (adenine1518-N6/adenine1519-N6)-dimethyltransferase|nr:16S rRNA (adenine(1518)-N(6)/adenine(1519)-N(6))-dimethyltransferase RsmA [Chitinophagaceae bacterium]
MNRFIDRKKNPENYTLKKSLGQHFLKDENICKKIVGALQQSSFSQLLEIGPGAGALTKYFLQIPDIDFKAVELDEEKVNYLETNFPLIKNKIIHKNFLEIDAPFEDSFFVAGNFPYNISSQILFKILEWKALVPEVVGMFQKEVARRVAAKSGNKEYGILSVLVQAFYNVELLFDVSPACFNPPPKVMSSVIRLKAKKETPEFRTEKDFFTIVKTAFNQRRKMLRNAVKQLFPEEILQEEIFNKRAEQLSLQDFSALTFKMK